MASLRGCQSLAAFAGRTSCGSGAPVPDPRVADFIQVCERHFKPRRLTGRGRALYCNTVFAHRAAEA
eukprot:6512698-Prymnesium_polylepis.1